MCALKQSKELKYTYVSQQLSKPTSGIGPGPGFTLTDILYKEILSLSPPIKYSHYLAFQNLLVEHRVFKVERSFKNYLI